jgi:hypothetical protein
MSRHSVFPKGVAVAAAVATLGLGGAAAHAAPLAGSAAAPASAITAPIRLGTFANNKTTTFEVDVPAGGEYQVSFFVNYPKLAALLKTSVDGTALADVVAPVQPNSYGVIVGTGCFPLTAGRHVVTVNASNLFFPIGTATLIAVGG